MIMRNETEAGREDTIRSAKAPDNLVFDVVPSKILANPVDFINASRKGIPGLWVKHVVEATGLKETFLAILGISPSSLSRLYHRESLSRSSSEKVLDAIRLIRRAEVVWESQEQAIFWLQCPLAGLSDQRPIDLFDTFEGRRWVSQVLNKIEYGEFS